MSEQTGTFYAVSVGPGDPELLTLQAVRVLENTPVIAAPQTASGCSRSTSRAARSI